MSKKVSHYAQVRDLTNDYNDIQSGPDETEDAIVWFQAESNGLESGILLERVELTTKSRYQRDEERNR